jgi:anaphase-promoting complex subunit 2
MMKDIADSKRINRRIDTTVPEDGTVQRGAGKGESGTTPMQSTIISKEYWPKLLDEPPFNLHPSLAAAHVDFEKQFSALKAPRKLMWKHNLGTVELELSFGGGGGGGGGGAPRWYDFRVSPAQASLLLHLRDQSRWTVRALSRTAGIKEALLRRIMATWVNLGVVRETNESGGSYEVNQSYSRDEDGEDGGGDGGAQQQGEEDDAGGLLDQASSLDAQALMYENFVKMMLANFKELPLERIHNNLSMFVPGVDQEISLPQLRAFLGKLCNEEKIALSGSMYTLVG